MASYLKYLSNSWGESQEIVSRSNSLGYRNVCGSTPGTKFVKSLSFLNWFYYDIFGISGGLTCLNHRKQEVCCFLGTMVNKWLLYWKMVYRY